MQLKCKKKITYFCSKMICKLRFQKLYLYKTIRESKGVDARCAELFFVEFPLVPPSTIGASGNSYLIREWTPDDSQELSRPERHMAR